MRQDNGCSQPAHAVPRHHKPAAGQFDILIGMAEQQADEPLKEDIHALLEQRLGAVHARQRLGLEAEHEAHVRGTRFFHPENWYSAQGFIRGALKLSGMYARARRNAHAVRVVTNEIRLPKLPMDCDGLRVLHLSDLHIDMSECIAEALISCTRDLTYDLCVMTGDYRFRSHGNQDKVLRGMAALRNHLTEPVYAVLGNHDSVTLVPPLEALGIDVLMNEHRAFGHQGATIHVAGIDDAHFFRTHNIQKSLESVPRDGFCLFLSHTPEVYREAAHAGADLFLCGHTHGGQICLPGGFPVVLEAHVPRRLGRGPWTHGAMSGYTSPGAGASLVDARINCPPEVTLHTLRAHA